jgi:hypothetical protein
MMLSFGGAPHERLLRRQAILDFLDTGLGTKSSLTGPEPTVCLLVA